VRLACTPVAPAASPYGPELITMTLRSVTPERRRIDHLHKLVST
jgi:hypothetical protein